MAFWLFAPQKLNNTQKWSFLSIHHFFIFSLSSQSVWHPNAYGNLIWIYARTNNGCKINRSSHSHSRSSYFLGRFISIAHSCEFVISISFRSLLFSFKHKKNRTFLFCVSLVRPQSQIMNFVCQSFNHLRYAFHFDSMEQVVLPEHNFVLVLFCAIDLHSQI